MSRSSPLRWRAYAGAAVLVTGGLLAACAGSSGSSNSSGGNRATGSSGRLVESGPTERVLESPQHPYTERLLAAIPRPGWRPTAISEAAERTRPAA